MKILGCRFNYCPFGINSNETFDSSRLVHEKCKDFVAIDLTRSTGGFVWSLCPMTELAVKTPFKWRDHFSILEPKLVERQLLRKF